MELSNFGLTAEQLDTLLPRGDDLVSREIIGSTSRVNASRDVEETKTPRARFLAEREAILATMESLGLIRRTR